LSAVWGAFRDTVWLAGYSEGALIVRAHLHADFSLLQLAIKPLGFSAVEPQSASHPYEQFVNLLFEVHESDI
jgi:hypothetical protein